MTRAVLINWHKYTPYGHEFYEPMLDFFLQQMKKYQEEYDMIYLLDSNWNVDPEKLAGMKATIIKTDPNVRYFDTYKTVLPQVKEDLVLFLDNDFIVYKGAIISKTFERLLNRNFIGDRYDVVSITDTIGTMKAPLKTGNKLCPYFFATRKELLMKYLDIDWGPDAMPYTETFGLLTEAMLKDGCKVFEMEDDKSNILFDGTQNGEKSKDTGFYHVRAGSTPAYLLATKKYGDLDTYLSYINNQPESELIRQCAWFQYMGGEPWEIVSDLGNGESIGHVDWAFYLGRFEEYHGLS